MIMSKILEPISISVWFDKNGYMKPSRWHYGSKILDLSVLQETQEGQMIRYICRCADDDEWEYFEAVIVFDKQVLKWYVER